MPAALSNQKPVSGPRWKKL